MYDAIIVGARCAGSPTAMLLARQGYRVLLVDRVAFPKDTISSHNIHPTGVSYLKRWGLLDRIIAAGTPAVTHYSFDFGDFSMRGALPDIDGTNVSYSPRRILLDKILADAAVGSGAEFRENIHVEDVIWDGDRVVGIRGKNADGKSFTEMGSIVIGADGRNSKIARSVNAPIYNARPPQAAYYYSYWSGIPVKDISLYFLVSEHRLILVFPTNMGLTGILVGLPHREFDAFRHNYEENYLNAIRLSPQVADLIQSGQRVAEVTGIGDLPNFFRKPYGDGWALVGDAGYHRDPAMAHGISDAFSSADLLATAIDQSLSQGQPMQETLARYEQQRNELVGPYFDLTCQLASLDFPPDLGGLLLAVSRNQKHTDDFFSMFVGKMRVQDFFAPANIQQIMEAAALEADGIVMQG